MNGHNAGNDAALYGRCVTCGAVRTLLRTTDDDGVILAMVCSADASHDQDAVLSSAQNLSAEGVTAGTGTGSYQHESNEQPPESVRSEPSVPGVREEVRNPDRGEPRNCDSGVPVVWLRGHDADDLTSVIPPEVGQP